MASAATTDPRSRLGGGARRAVGVFEAHVEKLLVAGLAAGFITISAWWVDADSRVPSGDHAKHTLHAFGYLDQFQAGHWLSPILVWTQYPPLVHVVGAAGAWIGGVSADAVVIAENVFFVPLLAAGCYQAGRIAFGPLAGVLAVAFAFAAPMTMSLFHVFMLDGPGAAVAAVAVWFLLASRRFASLPWTIAAAAAVAAGMYVKATFVFFVAGLALALLARGGWRHWRNAGLGFGAFLILVEPWYFAHLQDLRGMATGAIQPQAVLWYDGVPYPERWSVENFTWYWWSLLNNQLYTPLVAFFVVGVAVLSVHWLRRRLRESYVPELLAGVGVAYLGVSLLSLDDPRYLLPALVYFAVLGTGWITLLPVTARVFAVGALGTILLVNTVLLNYVDYVNVHPKLPGWRESPIGERTFTVLSNRGYIEGRPLRDPLPERLVALLSRAREDGAELVVFQPESMNSGGYNLHALVIFARRAGLGVPGFDWRALRPHDVYVFRAGRDQIAEPACLDSWDETGIYMHKGQPAPGKPYYCPPAPA